jgi:pimeloyl-ACP methyl ester carboxylesterase
VYYELHGNGSPLLLLHGGAGSGEQFVKQIPALSERHLLIVPDACAQGRTTDRPEPLTYHAMAEDVIALLDHLEVRRSHVMGWSDGGVVGLDLAIHHPDRIGHLVTLGANFSPDGLNAPDQAWAARAKASDFGPEMERWYRSRSPDPEHFEAAMTKVIALWRTEPSFTLEELGSIRAPTLIIAGEHDGVRRDHTEALARAIPGASLWIVPGASHGVMMEKPDLVNARILEFLRYGAPRRSA